MKQRPADAAVGRCFMLGGDWCAWDGAVIPAQAGMTELRDEEISARQRAGQGFASGAMVPVYEERYRSSVLRYGTFALN